MKQRVLIVGGSSVLAVETARLYARDGARLALVGRNLDKLRDSAEDLRRAGAAEVHLIQLDVRDESRYEAVVAEAWDRWQGLDVALVAHAVSHPQSICEDDLAVVREELQINFTSTICLLLLLASRFERQKAGTLAVISSVSGDRGRKGQYVYAAAKAGLNVFLQGLRQRLHPAGVSVVTLKPGLTETPLTARIKAVRSSVLFSSPQKVAHGMYRAIRKKKDQVYIPGYWRFVVMILKAIPESAFKRLKLDG